MPLRNTVLFPQQVIPIYVGREKSLKLIEDLEPDNKYLVVVAQQDGSIEDPKQEDLYSYGTLALVLKVFDMPDNSKSAIVQGVDRVKILKYKENDAYFLADVERIPEPITTPDVEIEALAKSLKGSFTELIKISPTPCDSSSLAQPSGVNGIFSVPPQILTSCLPYQFLVTSIEPTIVDTPKYFDNAGIKFLSLYTCINFLYG